MRKGRSEVSTGTPQVPNGPASQFPTAIIFSLITLIWPPALSKWLYSPFLVLPEIIPQKATFFQILVSGSDSRQTQIKMLFNKYKLSSLPFRINLIPAELYSV